MKTKCVYFIVIHEVSSVERFYFVVVVFLLETEIQHAFDLEPV